MVATGAGAPPPGGTDVPADPPADARAPTAGDGAEAPPGVPAGDGQAAAPDVSPPTGGSTDPADGPTASLFRRGVRLLWFSLRSEPRSFAVSIAGSLLYASMAVGGTWVLGRVTDEVILPGFDGGVSGTRLAAAAAALFGVSLLRSLGVIGRRYFGMRATRGMQRQWFRRVTDTYLRVPLGYFGRHPTGQLLAHADADAERAVTVLQPLPFTLGVILLIGLSVVSLALIDPLLMLIGLALFPTLAVVNQLYGRRVEVPAARTQARLGEVSAVAHESFEGALVVKSLGLEDREVDRLRTVASELRTARLGVGRLRAAFEPGLDALPNLGMVALVAAGSWRISTGDVTTGELVQAVALFGILSFPMRIVGFLLEELPRAVVAADRLDTVLTTPSRPRPAPEAATPLPPGPLDVAVEGLTFGYAGDRVLDGLDLTLAPGEVVALVGATGSGKSTLCHLLAHLYEPAAGHVRLGGVDLHGAETGSIRAHVALAFQESFLFGDTVRENLTLGAPVPDDEIAWALAQARADRFVARLPLGLEQPLGERGVTLSGGQRQRLALARALLRRPGLLMLDDATSAVDATIERRILDGLRDSLHATTLIVAHRVSTIALADRVLFLEGGRIAASGAHDELVATVPAYAVLARAYQDVPA
ncbi:MAG TPA: ABC transporter ATP-binding protein [Acidimicrobiales bacterium]|nr:ABC transporter ATP-binding protein [Acidimicrobiales bacterium]